MRLSIFCIVSVSLLSLGFQESGVDGIPFSGVTPNLSTGWFHKTGPTESLLFGLVVLKVLALRMAGVVPYNLNTLLAEGNFIDNQLKSWRRRKSSRSERDLFPGSRANDLSLQGLLQGEMDILERILLGLRRIDSHDCFLKHLCNMKQKKLTGNSTYSDDQILNIFSLKKGSDKGVWNFYREALTPKRSDCSAKFKLCPLENNDFSIASILNGIF